MKSIFDMKKILKKALKKDVIEVIQSEEKKQPDCLHTSLVEDKGKTYCALCGLVVKP